jgi:hypothetical protein
MDMMTLPSHTLHAFQPLDVSALEKKTIIYNQLVCN